ncbi:MAG TPA: chromate resistance protein ChrB domain-containing protein, partial [Gemmatimonadales bacterium]|nr:chromate resistance protein ChrB domain-containing protein [Gemmatimonadales bacterium]
PEVAAALGGTPFDMRGVELGHHAGRCSFETILHTYGLADPALQEIAAMVHDADLDDEKFGSPEAAGLDTVIRGLGLVIPEDHDLLEYTHRLYDGLYAWATQSVQP